MLIFPVWRWKGEAEGELAPPNLETLFPNFYIFKNFANCLLKMIKNDGWIETDHDGKTYATEMSKCYNPRLFRFRNSD